jgi:hypothetical protein
MFESGVASDVPVGSLLGALVGGPSFCDMEADRCTGGTEVSSSAVGIGTGLFGAAAALSLKSSLGLGLASGMDSICVTGRPKYGGVGPSSITSLTTIGPFSPSSGKGPS